VSSLDAVTEAECPIALRDRHRSSHSQIERRLVAVAPITEDRRNWMLRLVC
jgi:hypothetical protein